MTWRSIGTMSKQFMFGIGSFVGRIKLIVSDGLADKVMTITNAPLTEDRTIILPDSSGTIALIPAETDAQTTALTDITHSDPTEADYAIQDLVNAGGYGFVTLDEGLTVLAVIANLQARVAELETKITAIGFPES